MLQFIFLCRKFFAEAKTGQLWSSTEIKTVDDENEIEPYNLLISYWIRQCNSNDNILDQEKKDNHSNCDRLR